VGSVELGKGKNRVGKVGWGGLEDQFFSLEDVVASQEGTVQQNLGEESKM